MLYALHGLLRAHALRAVSGVLRRAQVSTYRLERAEQRALERADFLERTLPPEAKVANCAGCFCLVASSKSDTFYRHAKRGLVRIAGRVLGRPYCAACLREGDRVPDNHRTEAQKHGSRKTNA